MNIKTVSLAGICLLAAACAAPQKPVVGEGFKRMSGPEISSALVGNSLDGTDSGGDYVIYYPDATNMRITYQGKTDRGIWRIDGNRYCRTWQNVGKGKERCVQMYRYRDQINWVRRDKITDRSVLIPGNPANL